MEESAKLFTILLQAVIEPKVPFVLGWMYSENETYINDQYGRTQITVNFARKEVKLELTIVDKELTKFLKEVFKRCGFKIKMV